jgi:prephenate dehydrogenase/8-oxo-dGTP pyrophosphatase MutT (NUDIX family)
MSQNNEPKIVDIKVGILGIGLIGGSILRRLMSQVSVVNKIEVFCWNHNSRHDEAIREMGAQPCSTISEVLKQQPDFLIVATPIDTLESIFAEISHILEDTNAVEVTEAKHAPIILDVASVKQYPLELARKFGLEHLYVGTHPMYGTELTGFENSTANLGDSATWAVCPPISTSDESSGPFALEDGCRDGALLRESENARAMYQATVVEQFIVDHLVGRTVVTDASTHDSAVALSSHLPHVFAYELAGIISQEGAHLELAKLLNAGSFHGATRVAHGNPQMFEGMLTQNSAPIAALLRKVITDFEGLADVLESDNSDKRSKSAHHFIERSAEFRQHTTAGSQIKDLHSHDADGWIKCTCGKEHWGLNGAAGLFLVRTAEIQGHQEITHVLLQHRALWSSEGGTWGTPGGAIEMSENPIEGALREAYEEAGVREEDIEVLGEITRDHGVWRFTTVLAREAPGHNVVPQIQDQESLAVEWKTLEEIRDLPLLTAFGREFHELIQQVEDMLF